MPEKNTPENVEGLYTIHYIKHISSQMRKKRRRWLYDDAGRLWHRNEIDAILIDDLLQKEGANL